MFVEEKLNVRYEIAAIAQHIEQSRRIEAQRLDVQRVGSLSADSALWSAAAAFESLRQRWQLLRHSLCVAAPQQVSYRARTNERVVAPLSTRPATRRDAPDDVRTAIRWLNAEQIAAQQQSNGATRSDAHDDGGGGGDDDDAERFGVLTRMLNASRRRRSFGECDDDVDADDDDEPEAQRTHHHGVFETLLSSVRGSGAPSSMKRRRKF